MFNLRNLVFAGIVAVATVFATITLTAQKKQSLHQSATSFLNSLSTEQKAKATYPFDSEERFNWFFVPRDRKGLSLKDMTPTQQENALKLLATSLSASGYKKAEGIRQLEVLLHEMEQGRGPTRDLGLYYVTIFGEPSEKGTWAWRYEGHHLSLHWTSIKGTVVASSPQFLGSNPGEVKTGAKAGTRYLAGEEDLARSLVKSLNEEQAKMAILSQTAPSDIITGAMRKAKALEDKGIPYSNLTKEQQSIFNTVLMEYANVQAPETAKRRINAIRKSGMETVKFAWMGGLEKGQAHYYRIQGATFLIEYDNTQNNANHIHSVWRDFDGDFGEDLLAKHYKSAEVEHGHDHPHSHTHE